MARISPDQIGLRDAADVFGVSIDTLRRRIRDNSLDEAVLVQGPFGATWVLPRVDLEAIAEREGWDFEGVSRVSDPGRPAGSEVRSASSGTTDGTDAEAQSGKVNALASLVASGPTGGPQAAQGQRGGPELVQAPSAGGAPSDAVIDLTEADSTATPPPPPPAPPAPMGGPNGAAQSEDVQPGAPPAPPRLDSENEALLRDVTHAVSRAVAEELSDSVQTELAAVREAITAAEVRAVAADARTDAMRSEKGRLESQLKRAEADIEYWRSQHDRLDKDLDRERGIRTTAEKGRAVADAEVREARQRIAELSVEVADTQSRERALIAEDAALRAELDQTLVSMGWWSRRRLSKLQSRSSARTHPGQVGE